MQLDRYPKLLYRISIKSPPPWSKRITLLRGEIPKSVKDGCGVSDAKKSLKSSVGSISKIFTSYLNQKYPPARRKMTIIRGKIPKYVNEVWLVSGGRKRLKSSVGWISKTFAPYFKQSFFTITGIPPPVITKENEILRWA